MSRHLLLSRVCSNQGSKYCINKGVLNVTKDTHPLKCQSTSKKRLVQPNFIENRLKITEPEQLPIN